MSILTYITKVSKKHFSYPHFTRPVLLKIVCNVWMDGFFFFFTNNKLNNQQTNKENLIFTNLARFYENYSLCTLHLHITIALTQHFRNIACITQTSLLPSHIIIFESSENNSLSEAGSRRGFLLLQAPQVWGDCRENRLSLVELKQNGCGGSFHEKHNV